MSPGATPTGTVGSACPVRCPLRLRRADGRTVWASRDRPEHLPRGRPNSVPNGNGTPSLRPKGRVREDGPEAPNGASRPLRHRRFKKGRYLRQVGDKLRPCLRMATGIGNGSPPECREHGEAAEFCDAHEDVNPRGCGPGVSPTCTCNSSWGSLGPPGTFSLASWSCR